MSQRERFDAAVRKSGIAKHGLGYTAWPSQLERFHALIERQMIERCAEKADYYASNSSVARFIADGIRALGAEDGF